MQFLQNGKIMFDNMYEMYFNLYNALELAVDEQTQYLYDINNRQPLRFKDKYIKTSLTNPVVYAGKNDIVFDPASNYQLMVSIMGYFLDSHSGEISFIAQYIEDNLTRDKQRVCVKTKDKVIESQFYYNVYLGYVECIFALADEMIPDLSNLDIVELKEKK